MKNSLSKTLLCGVLATTFFLINCQKAPSRGVKAQAGPAAPAADANTKIDTTNMPECSPDFLKNYNISADLVKKLAAVKLDSLNESEKTALGETAKNAGDSVKITLASLDAIKKDVEGCVVSNKTSKEKTSYYKSQIQAQYDKIIFSIKDKVNIEVDGYYKSAVDNKKAFEEAQKAKQTIFEANGLKVGMKFIVKDSLAEVLKGENSGVLYFKNGEIIEKPSTEQQKKDREDLLLTTCEIGANSGDAKKGELATITSITNPNTKNITNKRFTLSVILTIESAAIKIDCLIADSMAKSAGSAFRKAFGYNLQTQTQLDAIQNKTDKVQTKTAFDKASEDRIKKEAAVKAASNIVDAAQVALDANEQDTKVAVDAKKDDEAKILTDNRADLIAALEKAKEVLKSAESELEMAKKTEGIAAQKN